MILIPQPTMAKESDRFPFRKIFPHPPNQPPNANPFLPTNEGPQGLTLLTYVFDVFAYS